MSKQQLYDSVWKRQESTLNFWNSWKVTSPKRKIKERSSESKGDLSSLTISSNFVSFSFFPFQCFGLQADKYLSSIRISKVPQSNEQIAIASLIKSSEIKSKVWRLEQKYLLPNSIWNCKLFRLLGPRKQTNACLLKQK